MTITVTSLGTHHATSTSSTITVAASAAIGDTVFVIANSDGNGAPVVTDSKGNTWTKIGSAVGLNGVILNGEMTLWYSVLTSALVSGTDTITDTATGAGSTDINAVKITGLSSTPLDTAVTNTATGTGTNPSVTSGTPTASGECFIAVVSYRNDAGTFTQDTTNGWAAPPNSLFGSAGPTIGSSGGNQVNAGTGTKTFAPTISNTSWAAAIVGFKAPSSPPTAFGGGTRLLMGVGA